MHYLYIATIFAGALVCLLASLLLFARSKTGERSRIILAVIVFFSVVNYITRFIDLCKGEVPEVVVSTKMLLVANFMVISYIMYPIEVISPGWLNFWRIVKLYAIWLLLCFVYIITSWIGLQYTPYSSIPEMFVNVEKFEVWFRLVLCLLMFAPVLFIFYIHRMKQNNNTDWIWLKKYTFTFFVNILAYIMVLVLNNPTLNILYYYISVGCSLYIAYMELFDRLLRKSMVGNYENKINLQEVVITEDEKTSPAFNGFIIEPKNLALVERLHAYMKENSAWRDPDLTLNRLASELFTNRTTLAQIMRESGYENYTNYINRLRINDFLQQIKSGESTNFQEAFFFVGFRSRSTALRNFRQFTGKTPSEYFKNKIQ